MATTSVRLQSDLESQLENLAQIFHRSKNWLINQAIREYIEKNQQETTRWEETLIALESVKKGQGIPEEDVDTWLKSWGTDTEMKSPEL
jgi:predicted transcriptional regulator